MMPGWLLEVEIVEFYDVKLKKKTKQKKKKKKKKKKTKKNTQFSLQKQKTIYMSHRIRKPTICICEIKGTDQLRGSTPLFSPHGWYNPSST